MLTTKKTLTTLSTFINQNSFSSTYNKPEANRVQFVRYLFFSLTQVSSTQQKVMISYDKNMLRRVGIKVLKFEVECSPITLQRHLMVVLTIAC